VVGTVALLPTIGSEFMPRAGQGQLSIELSLPQGTHLDRTEGVVRNLEAFLQQNFDAAIKHLYARVGRAGANTGAAEVLTDEHNAVIHVMLKPDAGLDAADLVEPLGRELAGLPALETSLGRTSAPLLVEIKGRDLTVLSGLAEEVAQLLTGLPTLSNVETGIGAGRPQIEVIVDRTRAAQHSLTVDAMGAQLEAILSGRDAGQLQQRGEYSDIVIRRPRLSLDELAGALLDGTDGRRVRLDEVATLKASESPRAISRNNRMRVMTVSAHLSGDRAFDQVAAQVQAELATLDLPPEYNFAITGEEKLRQESFENLRFALILAVVLVYMVMAAQFESLIHPFVILLTIPLAGVGAVLLLLVLGMPLNVMSFIGIIMLAGIAVNDSIILVDRINQNRRAGQALATAIEAAAQSRMRPIIMTSATTMLALLPLAIGFGEGANLRTPMAVAVIGGLVTSTALVIPCFYHLLARLDRLR
ncbi:MAG TPA: efflux RND transporter permease subunit, partial [Candidatus Handelsmanbacteria bacterium]|nr:efflux RND transporter permease subunit [Candidatus Handelsmanbacteria bacterium]